jgi:protein-S-isoprenylcysteine O-methyltransferase Ste14
MDVPGIILTATVVTYWCGACAMIVRVRRHARRHHNPAVSVMPKQPLERAMGLVWLPVIALWMLLPWLSLTRSAAPLGLPEFARSLNGYDVLRAIAAVIAVACLAATIKSWARMGHRWRMAVTDEPDQVLITDSMFARVRHPIYAFSILLMLCTIVVVPTPLMIAVGIAHIVLMVMKARNEERHLLARHGEAYASYVARTGRFLPRFR